MKPDVDVVDTDGPRSNVSRKITIFATIGCHSN